jgi:hypothetical protein
MLQKRKVKAISRHIVEPVKRGIANNLSIDCLKSKAVRFAAIQKLFWILLLLSCAGMASAQDLIFNLDGGGKFVTPDGEASIVRLTLFGTADMPDPTTVTNFGNMSGTLTAFNFLTYTEIESETFSLTQCIISDVTNFTSTGQGAATINGTPTNITFQVSNIGGVVTYEISDPVSGAVYMSGTGELNRSALQWTTTPNSGVTIVPSELPDGNMQVLASGGIPGVNYLVQATTTLNSPSWPTIGMATAGTNGMFSFSDLVATNFPVRFYRVGRPL